MELVITAKLKLAKGAELPKSFAKDIKAALEGDTLTYVIENASGQDDNGEFIATAGKITVKLVE
jgi:hypothetical protein